MKSIRSILVCWLLLAASCFFVHAQLPPLPPDPYFQLTTWSFNDTTWYSDSGYPPVSFTNLNNPPSFDGNALQVDSTNAAWLQYNIIEAGGPTNLTFVQGAIEFWVLPDWNSGTGPGDYGRLIDVGVYSTNNPSSWWSLYFTPDGNNLCFSAETNGVFTNYLAAPITWDTNTWHFVSLAYNRFQSHLYIDGQLATNGTGTLYEPDTNTLANGFFVGSDVTGTQQSRAQMDDLVTYNYLRSAGEIADDYTNGLEIIGGGSYADLSPPAFPGGGGSTNSIGTNTYSISTYVPDYGSNLWVATLGISNSVAGLMLSNSSPDILYELQGINDLTLAPLGWFSEGFVYGSELTNFTLTSAFASQETNLFLRIRSWQDSTGTGIPDWWWLTYAGQTTNVDAYALDPSGDGYTYLQKFQMGLNPTNYYSTNALAGFCGCLDATGTNVFLEWNVSAGPVTYSIQRGVQDTNGNYVFSQIGIVYSNATFFEDAGVSSNANWQNNIYDIEATYPGSGVTATNSWTAWWYTYSAQTGLPYGPLMPTNVYAHVDATGTNVLVSWTPAPDSATNHLIESLELNTNTGSYNFVPAGLAGTGATNFEIIGGLTNGSSWENGCAVVAVYPGGGLSQAANIFIDQGFTNGTTAPAGIYGYLDNTGTNLILNWQPSAGAVGYIIAGGNYNITLDTYFNFNTYSYAPIGEVSSNTTSFSVNGEAVDPYGDSLYNVFNIIAVYADGSRSQSGVWFYNNQNTSGLATPGNFGAYLDATGTNVFLSWMAAPGAVTNYVVHKVDIYGNTNLLMSSNTFTFEDVGGIDAGAGNEIASDIYLVQAVYPGGTLSAAASAMINTNVPAALNFAATVTGTNVSLTWSPAIGSVTNYVIQRGIYNPDNGTYSYSTIGNLSGSTMSFTDSGAIAGQNSYNNIYRMLAQYLNGTTSTFDALYLSANAPPPGSFDNNLNITAQLVRNETGRWQLMFSSIPASVQSITINWDDWDYYYDQNLGSDSVAGYPWNANTTIPVSSLTNGIYVLPDSMTLPVVAAGLFGAYNIEGFENSPGGNLIVVQPVATNGVYGNEITAGRVPFDQPAFADGREPLKQNLLYLLRAAPISNQASLLFYNGILTDTNYAECSIFNPETMSKGYGNYSVPFMAMDDLWPFTENYQLYTFLYDPNNSNSHTNFVWPVTLDSIPAPTVLGVADPYWTEQAGNQNQLFNRSFGLEQSPDAPSIADCLGAYTNSGNLYLQSGLKNLFGLSFATAMVNPGGVSYNFDFMATTNPPILLATGGFVSLTNVTSFYSQTVDPVLALTNYYFAAVATPGTDLPNENPPAQLYPIPPNPGFANTNQTGLLVASVGNPVVIGGWAKFAITNGDPTKAAYLGQYFVTNAYSVSNGVVVMPTNQIGVVSPYGNFFPMQPGQAALVTMPDPDSEYAQGTGVVDVISLNVDANHDGTMDFTYAGPDFVSPSKPFRFWVNDVNDAGDDAGDGIPGQGTQGDGVIQMNFQWLINGRRNLVDFFPVYLNIGSLFQSNALSAGISVTDTNYQFILSQSDGALRFVYTGLTPTNYMDFLQDTNVSGDLAYPSSPLAPTLTTISSSGVALSPLLMEYIATNNGGILLMEAWTNTTQPLVLTIYHGTNQIAQTSLPLSISGVEQMFRSKTMLLNPYPATETVPDRLTDASVPNEPDTTGVNFIFVHGYNVNPQQARGWNADYYKRLYWSGSHAKFWGVTWEGSDSQVLGAVSINLQTNIVNAFETAPLLNSFLNSLNGTNVVVAHSLGNMLVLATLNDYSNQNIDTYCMVDAALAIEAIDTNASLNSDMYPTAWADYENRLWASKWFNLWPSNDTRSTLTWSGRLQNIQNVSIYNFYSSGEEVLRDYPADPPDYLIGIAEGQLVSLLKGDTGENTWAWQEKLKGLMPANSLLSSDHGGWAFNEANANYYWHTNAGDGGQEVVHLEPSEADILPSSQLQTNAFFDMTVDTAMFTTNSSGSTYMEANRNRILSDAIPCLTLPVGANPVPKLDSIGRNFDMQTLYENGWPLDRGSPQYPIGTTAAGEWHHSDNRAIAYTFTYEFFDKLVTVGNLK